MEQSKGSGLDCDRGHAVPGAASPSHPLPLFSSPWKNVSDFQKLEGQGMEGEADASRGEKG